RQGFMQFVQPCPACHGRGYTIPKPYPKCKGDGIVETVRELSVRIPAGVYDGARLRLRGEGEMGIHGGPNGDLYVVLHVEDDDVFERDEQNLIYTATITFPQAALGTRIQIPSINDDETLELDIPKGTQNGKIFTIRGKGLKFPGQNRMGDLLVQVAVKTPTKLSSKQEELLREFERLSEEQGKGLFGKVKKAMGMD
ncbi:MAG: molecular chaperone DnaJ, partial [Mailhella sp.]|nr:molecular chaperone DnaJ [Mailhella sp.]